MRGAPAAVPARVDPRPELTLPLSAPPTYPESMVDRIACSSSPAV
jgi:hypothetical protein